MAKEDFAEVKELREVQEGTVIAPVTIRTAPDGSKRLTFALMRSFQKDTRASRTCWFSVKHVPGMRRMLDEVEKYLTDEEARLKLERKAAKKK